jgi:dTDP-4-dehydrorhamnose 3,5-epimerase
MKVIPQSISEVLLIEPKAFDDNRGFFLETWNAKRYHDAGLSLPFVQDNVSRSCKGVLRGLHLQYPYPQGKLVGVLDGEVLDVAVDVRVGSPSFGKWVAATLNSTNHHQLYIPPGFAHGFCVMSEVAVFYYKCTEFYHPESELGIAFNDKALNIPWSFDCLSISAKDKTHPILANISENLLPSY